MRSGSSVVATALFLLLGVAHAAKQPDAYYHNQGEPVTVYRIAKMTYEPKFGGDESNSPQPNSAKAIEFEARVARYREGKTELPPYVIISVPSMRSIDRKGKIGFTAALPAGDYVCYGRTQYYWDKCYRDKASLHTAYLNERLETVLADNHKKLLETVERFCAAD